MATEQRPRLPHIHVRGTAQAEPYTYPYPVRGPAFNLPARNRVGHSNKLLQDLQRAAAALGVLHDNRRAVGVAEDRGIYLEFQSEPGFELMLKSLDRSKEGIELVAVRERGGVMLATVFVAEGKLRNLERLVRTYRDQDDARNGQARNRKLVESISEIRQAVLESFWTDEEALFPTQGTAIWWEVWLRVGGGRTEIVTIFKQYAERVGMRVQPWTIEFTDRTVTLALATPEQMGQSVELLDCIAELRRAKERPDFFMSLAPREQAEWANDLLDRIKFGDRDLPAVCVLRHGRQ